MTPSACLDNLLRRYGSLTIVRERRPDGIVVDLITAGGYECAATTDEGPKRTDPAACAADRANELGRALRALVDAGGPARETVSSGNVAATRTDDAARWTPHEMPLVPGLKEVRDAIDPPKVAKVGAKGGKVTEMLQ